MRKGQRIQITEGHGDNNGATGRLNRTDLASSGGCTRPSMGHLRPYD